MSSKKRYVLVGTGGRAEFFYGALTGITGILPSLSAFVI